MQDLHKYRNFDGASIRIRVFFMGRGDEDDTNVEESMLVLS